MSTQSRQTTRILDISSALYRRTLLAYPAAFRHEYSSHMVQVFRDCSREALSAGGTAGLWQFWLIAFGDLVLSAAAEWRREKIHMSRAFWIRVGSLAGIFGGVLAALAAAVQLAVGGLQWQNPNSSLGGTLFLYSFVSVRIAPVLVLFYVLVLIGMQTRGAQRAGAADWVGITLALIGLIIDSVGNLPRTIIMNSQAASCRTPLNCNFYDPQGYFQLSFLAGILGTVLLALGLILYGVVALRRRVLMSANALPLILGLVSLASVVASAVATVFRHGMDYAGDQKIAILLSSISLASAFVWLLLGAALWPLVALPEPASAREGTTTDVA